MENNRQDGKPSIFWFRQDLRLSDNPGLTHAAAAGKILPIYIDDYVNSGGHAIGGAAKWWTHHALSSLNDALLGHLNFYKGDPETIISNLIKRHHVGGVYWSRCYEPWRIMRDARIKEKLRQDGIEVESFNASLLWEPWEVLKSDGTPYKVFTPFYRRGCLAAQSPRPPIKKPAKIESVKDAHSLGLNDLGFLPKIRWDRQMEPHWEAGEQGAQKRLTEFLSIGLDGYKEGRNFPATQHVSRLSPYLHSGEISPNQAWYAAQSHGDGKGVDHFCSELGWREFSYSLLYHFPALPHENWQKKFDAFPWQDDPDTLKIWQKGMTGYPLVDAGMRELWQTGYMHNRVRMVVASFLVKNLLIDWRHGARWFWDCLVDADLANNSASWQWVAGCGADAAPYFRIFNPVGQGEKFDADGAYTRRYVPELAKLPDKYLFQPWEAPDSVLQAAGVVLGKTYPKPVIDVAYSRQRALEALATLK